MNPNLKQDIMDTGRRLFREKGFHETSMRDIAASLDISVGNLTYHYKRKEDLIEAIAVQDHQSYQKPEPFHTLHDLDRLFARITDQKNSRPYYYRHYLQLSQLCPAIYEMQVSVLKDLSGVLTRSFQNMVENGTLKGEFSAEYPGVIRAIMTLMIYGLPDFYQLREGEQNALTRNCVWSILVPCLTERGAREYAALPRGEAVGQR